MGAEAERTAADGPAAQRWARDLQSWAIPEAILAAATRSPWGHQVATFANRADRALASPSGRSYERARDALLAGGPGSVLDVGAGVGAALLPLAPLASALTAVDPSEEMLAACAERGTARGFPVRTVVGRWPAVAADVPAADVVTCHHVVYDVADVGPFLDALTDHARRRVVLELPPVHPLTWVSPLWQRFHGLARPEVPTADDLVRVLGERGASDVTVDRWTRTDDGVSPAGDPGDPDAVATVTRRLCLPEEREPEVAAALAELPSVAGRVLVTVTWQGTAD